VNELQFETIDRKLDLITKLFACELINNKEYRDQVKLLDKIGFQPKEIAGIVGKSSNNVNVTLHLIRKSKKE